MVTLDFETSIPSEVFTWHHRQEPQQLEFDFTRRLTIPGLGRRYGKSEWSNYLVQAASVLEMMNTVDQMVTIDYGEIERRVAALLHRP